MGRSTKACSGRLSAILSSIYDRIVGSTLTHDQKPTAEILLRSEVLGSVLDGFKPICWSGRHMSILSFNILTV